MMELSIVYNIDCQISPGDVRHKDALIITFVCESAWCIQVVCGRQSRQEQFIGTIFSIDYRLFFPISLFTIRYFLVFFSPFACIPPSPRFPSPFPIICWKEKALPCVQSGQQLADIQLLHHKVNKGAYQGRLNQPLGQSKAGRMADSVRLLVQCG
jgi:hypothetical protein